MDVKIDWKNPKWRHRALMGFLQELADAVTFYRLLTQIDCSLWAETCRTCWSISLAAAEATEELFKTLSSNVILWRSLELWMTSVFQCAYATTFKQTPRLASCLGIKNNNTFLWVLFGISGDGKSWLLSCFPRIILSDSSVCDVERWPSTLTADANVMKLYITAVNREGRMERKHNEKGNKKEAGEERVRV